MKHTLHVKAFTLIEVLLAVSLMAMVGVIPYAVNFGISFDAQADSIQTELGHSIRKAQLFAMQGRNDLPWGIYIQSSSLTVFAGPNYASRQQEYDDVTAIDTAKTDLTITSGASEIVFTKNTGTPSASTAVSITSRGTHTKSISLSTNGQLTYN